MTAILFSQLAKILNSSEKDKFLLEQYTSVPFPPLYPPNSMLKWVRKEKLVPVNEYKNYEELTDAVAHMIVAIESKIRTSNMYSAFWDKHKSNPQEKTPKKEIEIHSTLLGLIQDECLLKSLEVNHEGTAGKGNLDFYISGSVQNKGLQGVCIEVKHAHNPKLLKGLTHQFPLYMKVKGSDFGIYLVLWFKGDSFNKPSYQSYHHMEDDLHKSRNAMGHGKMIKILTLDLTAAPTPSSL